MALKKSKKKNQPKRRAGSPGGNISLQAREIITMKCASRIISLAAAVLFVIFVVSSETKVLNQIFEGMQQTPVTPTPTEQEEPANWMDGLKDFESLIPLNELSQIYYSSQDSDNQLVAHNNHSEPFALIVDIEGGNNMTLNESLSQFISLPEGSLYIHRVVSKQDVKIMQRYLELTNNHCCHSKPTWFRAVQGYQRMFVDELYCWYSGCVVQKKKQSMITDGRFEAPNRFFYQQAKQTKTDKITKHKYHRLYDKHLPPFIPYKNKGVVLEIGYGCLMHYGAGESAKIWPNLLNYVHFVEYNKECVQSHEQLIKRSNYTVHVGDQADVIMLERLKNDAEIDEKGVDIMIDDGGHSNHQIIISFTSLWPIVNPGGLYFVEDFGESAYIKGYVDAQPIGKFGAEEPGTAQWFLKKLLENLFCKVTRKSCNDVQYVGCKKDICVIKKKTETNSV